MIRLFNHYFHAWTLRRIFFDFLLSMLALAGVILVQAENLRLALPMAGAQVVTLAAGLFVLLSALGTPVLIAGGVSVLAGFALRAMAIARGWAIPAYRV